ncbi:MAG: hypothetical protein IPN71_03290 [Fibrobacteres bacterium]|nr:hypothetical protein [Fibrobacterota bacterium]
MLGSALLKMDRPYLSKPESESPREVMLSCKDRERKDLRVLSIGNADSPGSTVPERSTTADGAPSAPIPRAPTAPAALRSARMRSIEAKSSGESVWAVAAIGKTIATAKLRMCRIVAPIIFSLDCMCENSGL